ncbi:MAG: hypothetical protein ACJ76V_13665 [Thermoleophilaceae bacterium]
MSESGPIPVGTPAPAGGDPRPAAVTFVTTEHFALQGARSQTIAESTGRASIFLASVSGGLVSLGLIATATHVGTAFYAFALILLPTMAFVGLVTFLRVLQNGLEDYWYAERISRLRAYYFEQAPEVTPYLMSVEPERRLEIQGLFGGAFQTFLTVAGMTAVITAVLTGASAGLITSVTTGHALAGSLVVGAICALAAMWALMRYQRKIWLRGATPS